MPEAVYSIMLVNEESTVNMTGQTITLVHLTFAVKMETIPFIQVNGLRSTVYG